MSALRKILDVLLSLRTSVILLIGLIGLFAVGAVAMPLHPSFRSITAMPLFSWLAKAPLGASWWLVAAIALGAFLALNTVACSIDSLVRKRAGRKWLLIISPQVIHAGFLLMLVGHLVSASGGFKGSAIAMEGTSLRLPEGSVMRVSRLDVTLSPKGFPLDWRAEVEYLQDGQKVREGVMKANSPSFFGGYGVYLKQVRSFPVKAAIIEVSRDPGTFWALSGGAIFTLGTIALVGLKMSREQ